MFTNYSLKINYGLFIQYHENWNQQHYNEQIYQLFSVFCLGYKFINFIKLKTDISNTLYSSKDFQHLRGSNRNVRIKHSKASNIQLMKVFFFSYLGK